MSTEEKDLPAGIYRQMDAAGLLVRLGCHRKAATLLRRVRRQIEEIEGRGIRWIHTTLAIARLAHWQADAEQAAGLARQAVTELANVTPRDPGAVGDGSYLIGRERLLAGDLEEALRILEPAVRLTKADPEAWFALPASIDLGELLLRLDRPEDAVPHLRFAWEADPVPGPWGDTRLAMGISYAKALLATDAPEDAWAVARWLVLKGCEEAWPLAMDAIARLADVIGDERAVQMWEDLEQCFEPRRVPA